MHRRFTCYEPYEARTFWPYEVRLCWTLRGSYMLNLERFVCFDLIRGSFVLNLERFACFDLVRGSFCDLERFLLWTLRGSFVVTLRGSFSFDLQENNICLLWQYVCILDKCVSRLYEFIFAMSYNYSIIKITKKGNLSVWWCCHCWNACYYFHSIHRIATFSSRSVIFF